jgi:predicted LPLAT superfamily acyltransferase
LAAYPVGFCYFLFSGKERAESRRFLRRYEGVMRAGNTRHAKRLSVLKHFTAFALTVVEKTQAWGGRIPFKRIHFQDDDITQLVAELEQGKGAALICSHLGNAELLRALADHQRTGVSRDVLVTSVLDFNITPFFNCLLKALNPRSSLKIISTGAVGPDSIIALKEETERGGLAVIAGDRTSAQNRNNCFTLSFLGAEAPFPRGPFLLAALLEVPAYAVFALRRKDLSPVPDYDMHVRFLGCGGGAITRRDRNTMIESWARQYASLLEGYLLEHPYQWYNFYDFWR